MSEDPPKPSFTQKPHNLLKTDVLPYHQIANNRHLPGSETEKLQATEEKKE